MSVLQSLQNLSFTARVNGSSAAPRVSRAAPAVDPTLLADFRQARGRLLKLFDALQQLAELAGVKTRFRLDLPDARSSGSLGLDLTSLAASLASTEEINAAPMSFSPFGPDWTGASDALITLGGEYNGANGTDTLTIESRRNGTHGTNNLRIWVNDSLGNRVANLDIPSSDPLDQQYDLGNGLLLTLGAGSTLNFDSATFQVFDAVGAVVNPNNPLGGIRNSNPNLQFGTAPIVDGAFTINGESINVSTADTINDVIARINASAAGVTATFNGLTESIDFIQNTAGSLPTIALAGDTSNFLAATKLSGALVTPGVDPDDEKLLEDVAAFSSVTTGNILINGQSIAIDPSADSLTTIVDKINASSADVTATFDGASQQVVIEANDSATVLELDSNGTNLFSALLIPEGRVDPEAKSNGVSRSRSYRIADAAQAAFAELAALFRDTSFAGGATNAAPFRSTLESALRGIFGSGIRGDLFGLLLDGRDNARKRGDFATVDRRAFTRNLQLRGEQVQEALGSVDGESGLLPSLLRATRQALNVVNSTLGISGTFVDTRA